MKQLVLVLLLIVVCNLGALAQTNQPTLNRDPEKISFVTADIDNFWRAFDLANKETDRTKQIEIYQREYLDKGSIGLQDFVRLRIKSAQNLVEAIEKQPRYYASVRSSTLRIKEMEKEMRKSFRKFKKLYQDAVFPDVYFLIGISNTGGTTSANGLLIGAEMYGATAQTPREELPDWHKAILASIEEMPFTVAHESCHYQQKSRDPKTLLGRAIKEGSCDFIGELISGDTMNAARKAYGDAHEVDLWKEFEAEMSGTNVRKWMYNGATVKDKPTDLGYYMGYKISASYYKNAKDKHQAIRDILEVEDFSQFIEKSQYKPEPAK